MRTKLLRFRTLYLSIFVAASIIASYYLPAYASRMPWIIMLIISDLYLINWFLKPNISLHHLLRKILVFLTLLPSCMLIGFFLSLVVLSPVDWNPAIRTYILGIVVLFYVIRVFPLCVLLSYDLKRIIGSALLTRRVWLPHIQLPIIISLIFSMVAAIFYLLGMILWVYDFQIVEKQIPVKGLPGIFNGYRIVHISDIHLGRWHSAEPLQRAFNMVNSLNPDLIAFTGDLVNYATSEAQPFKENLASLVAKDGIFGVAGNHDYGDYMRWPDKQKKDANMREMHELFRELGWVWLENSFEIVCHDKNCLCIAGTGNFSINNHYPNRADLQVALKNVPDSCQLILLTHNPKIMSEIKEIDCSINLILSGHTHGLQLGLKLCNREYSLASFVYRHWGGLSEITTARNKKIALYVNRGLGHIAIPLRLGMKPEITLLTLKSVQ